MVSPRISAVRARQQIRAVAADRPVTFRVHLLQPCCGVEHVDLAASGPDEAASRLLSRPGFAGARIAKVKQVRAK